MYVCVFIYIHTCIHISIYALAGSAREAAPRAPRLYKRLEGPARGGVEAGGARKAIPRTSVRPFMRGNY